APNREGFQRVEPVDAASRPVSARPARPVVDFPEPGAAAIKKELDKSITLAMGPLGLLASAFALVLISFWGGYRIGHRQGTEAGGGAPTAQNAAWMDLVPVPQELPNPGALSEVPAGAGPEASESAGDWPVTEADLAFENPGNHFTLVVDQHNDNDLGWGRALANYQYLISQGMPAVYPRTRGDVIYLLVGASPDRDSLDGLLKEMQGLPYPGSQDRTFSTAYRERIENFF
ncbi:MAG: hypothetical protein KDB61_15860, partial [Planctomycetes bacterium]|nr:hypothetical protein [Planctomycetota bacterium]